jgi:hypothetical protein
MSRSRCAAAARHILVPCRPRLRLQHGRDLASLCGVSTKALNQAVRRNQRRFPDDFVFQLTADEKEEVVTNCDHLAQMKFSSTLPYAFTEHGAIMAANVLNSERAMDASVYVVRAFVRLREMVAANTELARRLDELEKKYDSQFKVVFNTIRQLMSPPELPPKEPIGFLQPVGRRGPVNRSRRNTS